jgi:2-polyprenyl-6-methoxyphenol hydroxylase-like FAD-dependent oxidoreductase
MGIMEACRSARVHIREIVQLGRRGQPLWVTDRNFGADCGGDTGDVEILRDDLVSILHAAHDQAPSLTWVFGDTVTSLEQDENGVKVTFANGKLRRYGLVIGADDVHSNVRSLAFGPEAPFVRPLGFYAGIFPIPNLFGMDQQWFIFSLPGKVVSVMQYGKARDTRALFLFASPPLEFDRRDRDSQARLIRQAFEADRGYWGVRPLLDGLRAAADDLYFDDVTQVRMPCWSAGRVALSGAAAYAPTLITGQGTSMAVVGATGLAGELRNSGGGHRAAFAAYGAAMRPHVGLNQDLPGSCAQLSIALTWAEIERRDAAVRAMFPGADPAAGSGWEDQHSAGALIGRAANAINLKSYW